MTLTKAELADILVEKVSSVTKNDAKEIVELFFEEIRTTLERGEEIKISGFGNFALFVKEFFADEFLLPQSQNRRRSADFRTPRSNFPCQPKIERHGGTLL